VSAWEFDVKPDCPFDFSQTLIGPASLAGDAHPLGGQTLGGLIEGEPAFEVTATGGKLKRAGEAAGPFAFALERGSRKCTRFRRLPRSKCLR